jgi:chromate transporter
MASQKDSKSGQALLSSPTAGQLFTTFAAISLSGFGGVLASGRGGFWSRSAAGSRPNSSTISRGLVPVTLGLTAASASVIVSIADINWVAAIVTLATAVTAFSMRLHPLWAFAAAALLGAVGLIG